MTGSHPLAPLLAALRFRQASPGAIDGLDEAAWKRLLAHSDRTRMTLLLIGLEQPDWPQWVRARLRRSLEANLVRRERLKQVHAEIAAAFDAESIPHLVLKGRAHEAAYSADPRLRVQYDLDLYCPPETAVAALAVLERLGYRPAPGTARVRSDHFPPLIRPSEWQWKGDYFDPDIPIAVELHFRFWDAEMEQIPVPGLEAFWLRRDGFELHLADDFAYRSLHALRHLFRGSLGPYSVYELAWFLERNSTGDFWGGWIESHGPELRRLEAIAAALASKWFSCALPVALLDEWRACPEPVLLWLERFALAPLGGAGKAELWLHLELVNSGAGAARVLLRRLLPLRLPSTAEAGLPPSGPRSWPERLAAATRFAGYLWARAAYHGRILIPAIFEGIGWWWETRGAGRDYLRLLTASACYTLGLFVFVLLYNLHLLGRGFGEDALGLIAAAFSAGTLGAALPAGWLVARAGLRRALLVCFFGMAAVSAARALPLTLAPLMLLGAAGGLFGGVWMVALAPAVAALTPEGRRPLAFGLFFAANIALGIAGGFAGGRLPGWLASFGWAKGSSTFGALLAASALVLVALWPAWRLRFPAPPPAAAIYPRGAFIRRFLFALAAWNFATASFNPFFNAFFSRHAGASVAQIGSIYSAGQAAQVGALLVAPYACRRLGLVAAIAAMQFMTGLSLAGLGLSPAWAHAPAYCAYMAFQWMSEPAIYSLLMKHVRAGERAGASALYLLVTAAAQTLAAAAAGAALARWGYPPVLVLAGCLASVSGVLLWVLVKRFE